MKLEFAKYEGAGNDFVMVDGRGANGFEPTRAAVAELCDRRFGIGGDGLMILGDDRQADFRMRYFNADGGESTMCGNGGRCIALFAHHLGIGGKEKRFTAADGPHRAEIIRAEGTEGIVKLGMIDVGSITQRQGYYLLDTGSPHYVEFVEDVAAVDVRNRGAAIRNGEAFAAGGGTNVNFVQLLSDDQIRIRTFERGVEAETLACGTGATAAALATALHTGSRARKFRVRVEGGELEVAFESDGRGGFREITLRGPAKKVFTGTIETNKLNLK